MNHTMRSRTAQSSFIALFASLSVAASPAIAPVHAQGATKKVLGVEDYSRWRSIGGSSISSDGKWVTYVLSLTNTAPTDAKPILHLLRLDTNQDIEVANASAPAFSADARWIAYQVDPSSGGRGGRGGRGGAGGGGAPPAGCVMGRALSLGLDRQIIVTTINGEDRIPLREGRR